MVCIVSTSWYLLGGNTPDQNSINRKSYANVLKKFKNKRVSIKAKCINKKELQLVRLIAGQHFHSKSFNGFKNGLAETLLTIYFLIFFVLKTDEEVDHKKITWTW